MDKYILAGKEPKPASLIEWATWFETADRRVARTEINGYRVSTVFLGIDHAWGDGPPLLFETMVFPDDSADEVACERYSTWAEAEVGHMEMVEKIERGELLDPDSPSQDRG